MSMNEHEPQPGMSMFLASSIHDMKNSISILIGGLEHVLEQATPETLPAYQEVVHMMYETKRINNNLIQLLTLYKVGEDLYPFDPLPQSLHEFALTVRSQQEHMLQSRNITLEMDYDESMYWQFDEDLVGGVINHALNNAFHYTKDHVRLAIREVNGMLELRIEDNGNGFPPKLLQEGADAMRGIDFQGGSTGLGLHFSAKVASMHHRRGKTGEIRLENNATIGGCFILLLP